MAYDSEADEARLERGWPHRSRFDTSDCRVVDDYAGRFHMYEAEVDVLGVYFDDFHQELLWLEGGNVNS